MSRKILPVVIIALTLAIGTVFMARYNKNNYTLYGDAMGYYLYLPATIIYGNLLNIEIFPPGIELPESIFAYTNDCRKVAVELGFEHAISQYTYAVALAELPFFMVAHAYEKVMGLPANGYSNTYNIAIISGNLIYVFLAMLLLYKILRRYFSSLHSLLSLVLVLLATNLFWFTFHQAGMSHVPLFLLYTLLMYFTIKLYERPVLKYFMILGFIAGFITIMRPTDIVCLFIPLLYSVYNKATFSSRITFLKDNIKPILIAALVFIIPFIPQLIYWKMITGNYFFYSYGKQSFFWLEPQIIAGIFYFKNGWLPYAPVMVFALAGLFLNKHYKQWLIVILVMVPVYIYIIYSWYCYNYINGLGSRPMLHMYPLLAVPLAAFIRYVSGKGVIAKMLFGTVCLFFISVIVSLSTLMAQFKFKSQDANFPYFMEMIFKNKISYNALLAADMAEFQPDAAKLTKIGILAENRYNDSLNNHYVADPQDSTGFIYHIHEGDEYADEGVRIKYNKSDFKDAVWVRCSGRFMYTDYADDEPHILVFDIKDENRQYKYWRGCMVDNKVGIADNSCKHVNSSDLRIDHREYWRWGEVYFYTKIPAGLAETDELNLYMWNMNKMQLFYDDLKIELYK